MKVHTSELPHRGFTPEVPPQSFAAIAHAGRAAHGQRPWLGHAGRSAPLGPAPEPTVAEAVAEGADGHLLGRQAAGRPAGGFIVGRREIIARINKNPLKRALRMDKIRIAATEATLRLYRDPDRLAERLPDPAPACPPRAGVRAQAERLAPLSPGFFAVRCRSSPAPARSGRGAADRNHPSAALALTPRPRRWPNACAACPVPIIGRIRDGALLPDLRCLPDDAALLDALRG